MEDLTTYTEVDEYSYIKRTASRVTPTHMKADHDAYLYKDFGSDHFDRIDLMFSGMISNTSSADGACYIGFSSVIGDAGSWRFDLGICFFRISSTFTYGISLQYDYSYDACYIDSNTVYYMTLRRAAGSDSATLQIYTDSARTVLYDTLTISTLGTDKFRYFYPASNNNTGDSADIFNGYFENFQFGSVISGSGQIIGLDGCW